MLLLDLKKISHKILYCLIALVLILVCAGCNQEVKYEFSLGAAGIAQVEIGTANYDETHRKWEWECLVTIEDKDTFMNELVDMRCYTSNSPRGITSEIETIKITYANGNYVMIQKGGEAKYTKEDGFQNYATWITFDDEQFDALIDKYTIPPL